MKIIFLILICTLISCTKIERQNLLTPDEDNDTQSSLEIETSDYVNTIDVMVAFLWPERIETSGQRELVRNIIGQSRTLKLKQEAYLQQKFKLATKYSEEQCECVLNGLCEEGQTPEDQGECLEIEGQISSNESGLPDIYAIVENMEKDVKASGGEWLKTHNDYPELPPSSFDWAESSLSFSVLGMISENGSEMPASYQRVPFSIFRSFNRQNLRLDFQRLNSNARWEMELGIEVQQHSLSFQGILKLHEGKDVRQGIVYWLNPRKI